MVASLLLVLLPMNTLANSGEYPLKSLYPNGIEAADETLFSSGRIEKPIETGFEDSSEIKELLIKEDLTDELAISEDSYSGKFALKIQKIDDSIIPIYETEYFQTADSPNNVPGSEIKTIVKNVSGIRIAMRDKNVTVTGNATAGEEIILVIKQGETYIYVNQMAADVKGNYKFEFPLTEYGSYQIGVGGNVTKDVFGKFDLLDPATIEEDGSKPTIPAVAYTAKCNLYTLKLKPMYNSEIISFYVKVKKYDDLGNIEEDYALIKSDSDGDGAFSVGVDLSRGKWQTVQLDITDLDEEFKNGTVAGLYMKANKNSQWLVDDITSDYRKISETNFDLSGFAVGNVIYNEDVLRFANNQDSNEFNIGSRVVSGGVKISEQLSGIKIDSKLQFASEDNAQQQEEKEILYTVQLESDNCVVNNEGEEIISEKVQKPKVREEIPDVPEAKSMTVLAKPETEKRFRLLLKNKTSSSINITIQDKDETTKTYSFTNFRYTDWYVGDVTITSSYNLSGIIEIMAIEYETIEENLEKDILVGKNGYFTVDFNALTTDDRTKILYELSYENTDKVTVELLLEFFEGSSSEPYYSTKKYVNMSSGKQIYSNIVPKIKSNTKLKITNTVINNSLPVKIRFSGIQFSKVVDSDWNKAMNYVDYEIVEKNFNIGTTNYNFKQQSAKNIYSEEDEYAVIYPDAVGVINTGSSVSRWEEEASYYDISVYRILNLSDKPAMASVSTSNSTPIYLEYGLADYVVTGQNNYLALPPDEKVMLIAKTCYSNEKKESSPIHYTFVDGLYDGKFIKNETSITYSNVYDNGSAYKYDLEAKTSQKLTSDRLICASPDGTHLFLKDSEGKHYILNLNTKEKEIVPLTKTYRECFFNVKNELFVVDSSLSYYSVGELHVLYSGITDKKYYSYDFDSTGEYLLWSFDEDATLYKNTNAIWNEITNFETPTNSKKSALSNDISVAYFSNSSIYAIDLNTKTNSHLFSREIMDITDDNMLLFKSSDYYYLYNPVTAEKHKLFSSKLECDSMTYNPETNMITGILPNSRVIYQRFTAEEPEARYAISFDGRDNWYAYNGGRWQIVSKKTTPSGEELRLAGMTASAVNIIPASAYDKLYANNTNVLTVDVAIYMYSDSQKRTPAIEKITVETVKKDELDGLCGIHIEKYKKEDYRKITSLFPVENFGGNAECYYLFYIGNDWLYTYKNNELVKVDEPANALLSDMSETWVTFKQYGMTAKDVRRVPEEVLSQLFVNDEFANDEFGVIYVIKTKNEDTSEYVVNFRLGASADFVTNDDIVVEIIMNGGEVKVIDSTEFSSTDIENLLGWIEARQSGNGEIFYRIKNEKTQHFINYYMINSISVYNGDEYRAKTEEK